MPKSTTTYWNPLIHENDKVWESIENTNGLLEQLTLAILLAPKVMSIQKKYLF